MFSYRSTTCPYKAKFILLLASAVLIIAASGCTSLPKVHSLYDKEVNFASFKTYGYADRLGVDGREYTTLLTKYLKTATSRELEKYGYTLSDDPDLLVNFYVRAEEKLDVYDSPYGPPYYHFRYGYGPWPYYAYETRIKQYTQGTLNIDLVDAKKKQLVWEGVAIGRVPKNVLDNLEAEVNQVVRLIFEKYPFIAGSNLMRSLTQDKNYYRDTY